MISTYQKIKRSRASNSESHLASIYSEMKNSLAKKKINKSEQQKAKTLEDFLKELKKIQENLNKNNVSGKDKIAEAIEELTQDSIFNTLYRMCPQLFTSGFLITKEKSNNATGLLLEEGIANLIKSFGQIAIDNTKNLTKEQKINIDLFLNNQVNTGQATFNLTEIPDAIAQERLVETWNQTREQFHKVSKSTKEFKYLKTMPAIQGKIDVQGLRGNLNLNISTDIDQGIIATLQDATFTLKNYTSTNDIHLGKTNPFRVYVAAGANTYNFPWVRIVNCLEHHSKDLHPKTGDYFYRIRAIYELTGYNKNGSLSYNNPLFNYLSGEHAKYLIFNQGYIGGVIRVIPTSSFVINDSVIDNLSIPTSVDKILYGPISIPQSTIVDFK